MSVTDLWLSFNQSSNTYAARRPPHAHKSIGPGTSAKRVPSILMAGPISPCPAVVIVNHVFGRSRETTGPRPARHNNVKTFVRFVRPSSRTGREHAADTVQGRVKGSPNARCVARRAVAVLALHF